MFLNFLLGVKIFVFIFSILFILRNLYSFIKVLYMKEGRYDASSLNLSLLATSISYVITILILGF
jgi:hypothetical protein